MRILNAIPILPVKNVMVGVEFYTNKRGFSEVHQDNGFAILKDELTSILSGKESILARQLSFWAQRLLSSIFFGSEQNNVITSSI